MDTALAQPIHQARVDQRRRVHSVTAPPPLRVVAERPRSAVEVQTAVADERAPDISPRVIAQARRGDHKAFVAILRHHDRRLRLIAYRILRDRDLMDDALQDIAIKAFRALPTFRGSSSVGTWLYRIAYTTCIDYVRRDKPVELYPADQLPEFGSALPDTADVLSERDLLERALARLTHEQRVAVLLIDQEGLDYGTAAQIVGIPPGTIASRLSAARAALRRHLGDEHNVVRG
jgi:RNA polymerase sigma-70 factor (ECF subfamily)